MMKKKYINPTMEVVDIKANTQLLAGSPGLGGNYGGGGILSRDVDDFDEIEDPRAFDDIKTLLGM